MNEVHSVHKLFVLRCVTLKSYIFLEELIFKFITFSLLKLNKIAILIRRAIFLYMTLIISFLK